VLLYTSTMHAPAYAFFLVLTHAPYIARAVGTCRAGTYVIDPSRSGCEWCPHGKFKAGNTYETACYACTPTGAWTEFNGRTSQADCKCNSGFSGTASPGQCVPCVIGGYKPTVSWGSCLDCAVGWSSPSGSRSIADCKAIPSEAIQCPPGQYVISPAECSTCANGKWKSGTNAGTSCFTENECPGFGETDSTDAFQSDYDKTQCHVCQVDQPYCCPPGQYVMLLDHPHIDNGICAWCGGRNRYKDGVNAVSGATMMAACGVCPGWSVHEPNGLDPYAARTSLSCMCNAGHTYSALALHGAPGATVCPYCAAGKYKNVTGLSPCVDCDANAISPVASTDAAACLCNEGYTAASGGAGCTGCPSGTYKTGWGPGPCVNCDPGKFSATVGSRHCVNCWPDSTSMDGSPCMCKVGSTGPDGGGGDCEMCHAGTYKAIIGSSICLPCPVLSDSSVGSTGCKCGPGAFENYDAASHEKECVVCPAGKYKTSRGSRACNSCDADKSSPVGASASTACVCHVGFALTTSSGSTCQPVCGDGRLVYGEGCDDGNTIGSDGCSAICAEEYAAGYCCSGGSFTSQDTCVAGSCGDGKLAGNELCDDGNARSGDGCSNTCAQENGWDCTHMPCGQTSCTEVCGNGVQTPGEECDDGNTEAGDGCSDVCAMECGYVCDASSSPQLCATVCGDGMLAGAEACDDDNSGSGDGCNNICAVESGWECTTSSGCGLTSCAAICGDGKRVASETCDDGNIEPDDGCSGECTTEWQCGYSCSGGSLTTRDTCKAVYCGDGLLAGDEACDDANAASGDGCSSTCQPETGWHCSNTVCGRSSCAEVCGNSLKTASEACDDGNTEGGDGCSGQCIIECGYVCDASAPHMCRTVCGDGDRALVELCDDGNTMGGDGCDHLCVVEPGWQCPITSSCGPNANACAAICGDGKKIVSSEGCDDGNTASGDGCSDTCGIECGYVCDASAPQLCEATRCGDGLLAGDEWCDDGNTASGDGCSSGCLYEIGWFCHDTVCGPSDCTEVCGDYHATQSEACDDGNTASGDGCSDTCALECGYFCDASAPQLCESVCGDGMLAGNEACDDNNTIAADGCSGTCAVESGWECTTTTSTGCGQSSCAVICGDGKKLTSEGCDDGNTWFGDGCSGYCTVETDCGYSCSGGSLITPDVCEATRCGDGLQAGDEACDDGNTVSGDGCSSGCETEIEWSCRHRFCAPTVCSELCGNKYNTSSEECDDGNTVSGDGCSDVCAIEYGYVCDASAPQICAKVCADGKAIGARACDDDLEGCSGIGNCIMEKLKGVLFFLGGVVGAIMGTSG